MDPNATVQLIRDAIGNGDYDIALENANNLREWLAKGGFKPNVSGWPETDWLFAVHQFGLAKANLLFFQIDA